GGAYSYGTFRTAIILEETADWAVWRTAIGASFGAVATFMSVLSLWRSFKPRF
ncbi:hypothetical protein HQ520_13840, partial [bacterium]|nr:hypothetical protein [bacterium]